ncbi:MULTISPECIES: class I SAM-dependent methyltransferase [Paenibacillus]|uniref:class I SAM-dependent methyltransferase n=1 Tax=Paenibacillus TaxID=44249 RepID=UPI0035C7DBE5
MKELWDENVWETAWKEDAHTAVNKMKQAGIDPARSFDNKAKAFNEQAFNEEGRRRAKRIMNWLEGRGVTFADASILDIGAASGGFTVPFALRGASVTAVESSPPLVDLLKENTAAAGIAPGKVEIAAERFEDIDIQAKGWEKAFDFVFVSMCPVIVDWESVEKVLSCARDYCYISLSVGSREHSLVDAVWPLLADKPRRAEHLEMSYLLNLLLLKGYSFETLVTREMKTTEVSVETALEDAINWLNMWKVPTDERNRTIVADYLASNYPHGKVEIRQGGRFGKVLVRLKHQHMLG